MPQIWGILDFRSFREKLCTIIHFLAYRPLCVKTSEVKHPVYYILTKGFIFIVLIVYSVSIYHRS